MNSGIAVILLYVNYKFFGKKNGSKNSYEKKKKCGTRLTTLPFSSFLVVSDNACILLIVTF